MNGATSLTAGNATQAGFGPMDAKTGILPVAGKVYDSDASAYAGDPRYAKTYWADKLGISNPVALGT